jgi:hypothetical protein
MSLRTPLRRGDWVKLESTSGSVIIGQAQHDKAVGGYSDLRVLVGGDLNSKREPAQTFTINVNMNYWTVTIVQPNNLVDEG